MNLRPCIVEVVQQVPDVDVAIVAARVAERLSMPAERVRKLIERRTGPITKALRPDKAEAIAQTFQAAGVRVIVRTAEPDELDPPPAAQPVVAPPAVTEAAEPEPAAAEPTPTEPVDTEPVVAEPVVSEPAVGEPATEPFAAEPLFEAVAEELYPPLAVETGTADDLPPWEEAPAQQPPAFWQEPEPPAWQAPLVEAEPPAWEGVEEQIEDRGRPVARLRVEFEPPRVAELQPEEPQRPEEDPAAPWQDEEQAFGTDGGYAEEAAHEAASPDTDVDPLALPSSDGLPPAIVVEDEPPTGVDEFAGGRGWDGEAQLSWDAGSLSEERRRTGTDAVPEVSEEEQREIEAMAYGRAGRPGAAETRPPQRVPTAWRGLTGEEDSLARPEGARLPRRMGAAYVDEERVQRRRGIMLLLLVVAIVAFVFTQWWVGSRASAAPSGMDAYRDGHFAAARRLWLDQAAAADPTAQFMLGYMAEAGLGADWSARTAAGWYLQAATAGHAEAAWRLGRLFQEGMGVAPDAAEARRWFRSAAEAGHAEAAFAWGSLILRQSMDEAAYRRFAARGAVDAALLPPASLREAAVAFRLATELGWHEAAPYAVAFEGWSAGVAVGRP